MKDKNSRFLADMAVQAQSAINPTEARAAAMSKQVPFIVDTFNCAESDMYFDQTIKLAGGLAKWQLNRQIMPIELLYPRAAV